jgi:hypothetical protein
MDWSKIDFFGAYLHGFSTGIWIILKVGWPYILGLIALKLLILHFEKKYPKKKDRR